MADQPSQISSNADVRDDGGNVYITVNQEVAGKVSQRQNTPMQQRPTMPMQGQTNSWPVQSGGQGGSAAGAGSQQNSVMSGFSLDNIKRRAKFLGGKMGNAINGATSKALDSRLLGPLAAIGDLAKILLIIAALLLLISFICFFTGAWLWGILGILVDAGVGVGVFFGVQAAPMKAKIIGIAAIAIDGFMLIFNFVRMFMGR